MRKYLLNYIKYGLLINIEGCRHMKNKINFQIKNYGIINEADIEVNKINVIGGINSSGKSTASKVLYSFLRTFSSKEQYFLFEEFIREVNFLINCLINGNCLSEIDGPCTIDDSCEEVLEVFKKAELFFKSSKSYNLDPGGYAGYFNNVHELIEALEDGECLFDYETMSRIMNKEALPSFKNGELSFYGDSFMFTNKLENNSFFHIGFIENVFYIDSLSLLDLVNMNMPEHNEILLKQLKKPDDRYLDGTFDDLILSIENIINGKFADYSVDFGFQGNNEFTSFSSNTASGIKQIGIVQILLINKLLKKNCYLIFDEPEVNLHPEWQIKFAEILVLLAKELNITLYLNSHSPIFIEAISLYAQYYDLIDETNFYLTVKQENNMYNFKKIDSKDMGEVYENLTKPYDELDKLKAKILFKE